jgi:hypothetical protein
MAEAVQVIYSMMRVSKFHDKRQVLKDISLSTLRRQMASWA